MANCSLVTYGEQKIGENAVGTKPHFLVIKILTFVLQNTFKLQIL